MNSIRFASKEAFMDALEARRRYWRDYDKRQAAAHRADEKQWLMEARTKLRDALKMDYSTLKETHGYSVTLGSTPRCPLLQEPKIDAALRTLGFTQAKSFLVSSEGGWADAHSILTWDPDAPKSVC